MSVLSILFKSDITLALVVLLLRCWKVMSRYLLLNLGVRNPAAPKIYLTFLSLAASLFDAVTNESVDSVRVFYVLAKSPFPEPALVLCFAGYSVSYILRQRYDCTPCTKAIRIHLIYD